MKKLITTEEVRQSKKNGNVIYIDSNTLITPGAKDLASELGVEIRYCKAKEKTEEKAAAKKENQDFNSENIVRLVKEKLQGTAVSDDVVSRIVKEVVNAVTATNAAPPQIVKECDPSGIRLVRGGSVVMERFDTGVATDKVGIREVLNIKECPNLATGFMEFEKSSFDWTLGYDELDYIVEGNMDITVNGTTYHGHAGDVFFIPMNTSITFGSPDYCKFFFTAYPANWQELSNKK
jgi:ethanolamine utilization protein EutQ